MKRTRRSFFFQFPLPVFICLNVEKKNILPRKIQYIYNQEGSRFEQDASNEKFTR